MSTGLKKYGLFLVALILIIVNVYFLHLNLQKDNNILTFAMLDVDQGDGLFIESPTGTQILIDAGPPRKIQNKISGIMSPLDKSIDAIIITNPDADHIGGFSDVLKNYKVGQVFESGTFNDSKMYQNLRAEIKSKNIPRILAKKGMRLNLGGGAVIDVLFPDRDVSLWDTNDGSIVAKLTYGETSIMLTGDSTKTTENIVVSKNSPALLDSTILKIGHHGSRTSSGSEFVRAVSPKYALISNGKDNNYGHPHTDTLDTLNKFGVKVFRTDLLGTIIMKSDGRKETFSFAK
jgi:competence protein ComEC